MNLNDFKTPPSGKTEVGKVTEEIIAENDQFTKDEPFIFGIELLDNNIEMIHLHATSSYKQISAISVLDIAYVWAYGGLRGTAHYVFDASPSATGKDSAADRSFELHLKPIMHLQNEKKKSYAYDRQSRDEKLPAKSFHCIHTSDATPQGTYCAFETTKAQYPRLSEIGDKMQKKEHPLMTFITDGYGKHTLIQPNYKKDLDADGDLSVEGISLFFYGNSNIKMMGLGTFLHHLQGGLLNRCVLVYNTYRRAFDERPHDFDLPQQYVSKVNEVIHGLIRFAQKYSGMAKPIVPRTEAYETFDKYIFDQTIAIGNTNVQDLLKRTMQNLNAIILTLHYLTCYEKEQWIAEIAESTVLTGIKYMRYIIDGYSVLIDEIIGAAQDERDESNTDKLHVKVRELNVPGTTKIRHRDLYRALHLSRKEYDALLESVNYKTDKRFLYPWPVTG